MQPFFVRVTDGMTSISAGAALAEAEVNDGAAPGLGGVQVDGLMLRSCPVVLIVQGSDLVNPSPSAPDECLTIRTSQAERAYELARVRQPDVVAIDVATAGGPGWALCRLLKRDPLTSAIPVVVLAAESPETDAHARFAGVSGVLPELASIAELLSFVREPLPESSAA